jgi:YHS domain-containing protein
MGSETKLTYSMPLEVYLHAAVVRGVLVTNQDRLSGHLILRKGEEFFFLSDATLESFDRNPIKVPSDEYVIYKREVYLIADLSPQEQSRRTGTEPFYVEKQSSQALISLGPYLLQGAVHLFPGGALHDLLLEKSPFFPVTEARFVERVDIGPRTYLVNRSRIGFMTAIGDGIVEL